MADPASQRILVVDDDPGVRSLLLSALAMKGYEVDTASSGEQALELFQKWDFDLVILDSRMPGMSGADVVDELEKLPADRHPKVILATGRITQRISVGTGMVVDVIRKPFKLASLFKTIESVLKAG